MENAPWQARVEDDDLRDDHFEIVDGGGNVLASAIDDLSAHGIARTRNSLASTAQMLAELLKRVESHEVVLRELENMAATGNQTAQIALAACKPRVRSRDVWRGSPGPLVCSDSNHDDQYTCVGYGHVYLCIRDVKQGAVSFDCAPYVPSPIEAP